jgi:mitochondrial fission protein ELM1
MSAPTCWVVTDGKPGMENQCLGLAVAAGFTPVVKQVAIAPPWKYLPPQLWISPLRALAADSDPLEPPWPEVLIASGRQTVALSIAIRKASHGATFTVQIQNPTVNPGNFDLVVAPAHDRLKGENVLLTHGALHRINETVLEHARKRFEPLLAPFPRPLIAVLIGGSNRAYKFTPAVARRLTRDLKAVLAKTGGGLAVTCSRRTDAQTAEVFRAELAGTPCFWWNGEGENPYFGFLALADAIVVTADSISMISEACSTGTPVFLAKLEGGAAKFERFHRRLIDEGRMRPFTGSFEHWTYAPLRDTDEAAVELRQRLEARRRGERV